MREWYIWLGVAFLVVFGGIAVYVDVKAICDWYIGGGRLP